MKVVFCLNDFGSYTYNVILAKASILSVLKNTDLTPIVFYTGENPYFLNFLQKNNIQTHSVVEPISYSLNFQHSSSKFWELNYKKIINFASGAFLRFQVANYIEDDYCFYADIDTLFTEEFSLPESKPKLIAMSKQSFEDNAEFNSGVIYFNLKEFKKIYKELIHYSLSNRDWVENMYDQHVLNNFCKNKIEELNMTYNWRPQFGIHKLAKIVHFEKVKPLQGNFDNLDKYRYNDSYEYYQKYFFTKLDEFNI